jgi:hypothetical protein
MKKEILFLLIVIIPSFGYSQDCNCLDNYKWVKKTFEENDAGFQYAIEQRTKRATCL